jgi:outer membrane receptor protein involved in Fe transport
MDANQFSTSVSGALTHSLPPGLLATGKKLLPAVVSVMTTVGLVFPAQAQMVLEEVLVVAQKRTQNLQDVPVAVTAFSGEDLEISGIEDIFDLSNITPGWKFRVSRIYLT